MKKQLNFANDYLQGAHPNILKRMVETNQVEMTGYGTDHITQSAIERIREACACPQAEVRFLISGTQTNQIMINSLLQSYQGVIAAKTGHVSVHEAGAIEFGGHKVLELDTEDGKLTAQQIKETIAFYLENAKIIKNTLKELGFTVFGGENSPYIWLKAPNGLTSWEFFDELLHKLYVVGTPGSGFGAMGEGYFRLTAFGDRENTLEAMERFRAAYGKK